MDFRKIITKMRDLDPTTPSQDLQHYSTLAESTGIALGAKQVVTEAAKPDYIDIDGDGDKKEPMKKAAKDKKNKKEKVKEAAEGKMPSKAHVKKMCKDGMTKAEMCKMHPDCDQPKLKAMIDDCKKEMKESVNESVEVIKDPSNMSFVEMLKLVKESGGQQQIDPVDETLWNWAQRVAKAKVEESNKAEIFAGMIYERNGGRFEMYDVMAEDELTESKKKA